jgi:hypothetical protein
VFVSCDGHDAATACRKLREARIAAEAKAAAQWREEECSGAFDGFQVMSDADSGL